MLRTAKAALASLAIGLALVMVLTVDAQVTAKKKTPPNLKAGLVEATKEKDKTIEKLLKAMGPALTAQITAGRQVEIAGMGTFRVVRIDEYKDLINGRPGVVPAKSYIEFVPSAALDAAANAPGAVPSRTVPAPEFRVNPSANPGNRTEGSRSGRTRIR